MPLISPNEMPSPHQPLSLITLSVEAKLRPDPQTARCTCRPRPPTLPPSVENTRQQRHWPLRLFLAVLCALLANSCGTRVLDAGRPSLADVAPHRTLSSRLGLSSLTSRVILLQRMEFAREVLVDCRAESGLKLYPDLASNNTP